MAVRQVVKVPMGYSTGGPNGLMLIDGSSEPPQNTMFLVAHLHGTAPHARCTRRLGSNDKV